MIFPPVIMRLLKRVSHGAVQMSWPWAIFLALAHGLIVAMGYALFGERELVSGAIQFIYFYVVTGSSVGYGDFSPASDAGKLFTAIWVIPGAISIFAFLVGKIIASITERIRKKMNGYGHFSDKTGHIVVLGHVRGQTERLLEETERLHGAHDMIIVTTDDLSGQQDGWDFIRATSLSNEADLKRAGICGAQYVVILGRTDDESMSACLAVTALGLKGHCVAYFREHSSAKLIEANCPQIEIVASTSVEQVARALSDPGAGEVLRRLVNVDVGATLHSIPLKGADRITVAELLGKMMINHRATLIGYRSCLKSPPVLALTSETVIEKGQIVYYVAENRLDEGVSIAA